MASRRASNEDGGAGADTYWEVWDPSDWEKSPYGNCRINSFCHAWSCTVGYLLRTHFNETGKEVR